jgi:hypothetical protein
MVPGIHPKIGSSGSEGRGWDIARVFLVAYSAHIVK